MSEWDGNVSDMRHLARQDTSELDQGNVAIGTSEIGLGIRDGLAPKILESRRGHLSVAHRVADRLVPQVRLQGPCIDAVVGELKASRIAQQVRMNREADLTCLGGPMHHPQDAGGAEGRAALADKHEGRFGLLLAVEPPESA